MDTMWLNFGMLVSTYICEHLELVLVLWVA